MIKLQLKVIKIPCMHSLGCNLCQPLSPQILSQDKFLEMLSVIYMKECFIYQYTFSLSQVTYKFKILMKTSYQTCVMHQICLTVAALNQETNFTLLKYNFEDQNAHAVILCVLYCGKAADHGPRSHHAHTVKHKTRQQWPKPANI